MVRPMRRGSCALVATLAVLVVFTWTAARIHFLAGGNWTALFWTGAGVPLPPELQAGTYRMPAEAY